MPSSSEAILLKFSVRAESSAMEAADSSGSTRTVKSPWAMRSVAPLTSSMGLAMRAASRRRRTEPKPQMTMQLKMTAEAMSKTPNSSPSFRWSMRTLVPAAVVPRARPAANSTSRMAVSAKKCRRLLTLLMPSPPLYSRDLARCGSRSRGSLRTADAVS